jgi:hypothetical protein
MDLMQRATTTAPIRRSSNAVWRVAQAATLAITAVVLLLLLVRPTLGLFLTWSVFVPIVPALLLVAPAVWRNICPIAVVHQAPARLGIGQGRRLPAGFRRAAPAIAAILFFAIVPLRLLSLNQNAAATAAAISGMALLGLVGGLTFAGKSGWCATFCPVLPVERLYGQQPLLEGTNVHCTPCDGCVGSCYDMAPDRSLDQWLDPARRTIRGTSRIRPASILSSRVGLFAAAFPGFVAGYFQSPAGIAATRLFLRIGIFAATAGGLIAGVQWVLRLPPRTIARVCAAAGAAIYYWYTGPTIVEALRTTFGVVAVPVVIPLFRLAALMLIGLWITNERMQPTLVRLDQKPRVSRTAT